MSVVRSPNPAGVEGPRPTSPSFGASTVVGADSEVTVAEGTVERPSDYLASPFPESAVGLGWEKNIKYKQGSNEGKGRPITRSLIDPGRKAD